MFLKKSSTVELELRLSMSRQKNVSTSRWLEFIYLFVCPFFTLYFYHGRYYRYGFDLAECECRAPAISPGSPRPANISSLLKSELTGEKSVTRSYTEAVYRSGLNEPPRSSECSLRDMPGLAAWWRGPCEAGPCSVLRISSTLRRTALPSRPGLRAGLG